MTFLFLGLSYLLGAIPTSYWAGKAFHGIDLRQYGSGNLGATNAFRVLGWRSAALVVTVDILKGFVPVWFFPGPAGASFAWTLAFGAAAIMGHMFSVWVGFKGGKGMATSAGVFLALAPWACLSALGIWILLTFSIRIVSVASIGAAVALPILVALLPHQGGSGLVLFTAALAVFVIWAHRANVRRLLKGEEHRFGRPRQESTDA